MAADGSVRDIELGGGERQAFVTCGGFKCFQARSTAAGYGVIPYVTKSYMTCKETAFVSRVPSAI